MFELLLMRPGKRLKKLVQSLNSFKKKKKNWGFALTMYLFFNREETQSGKLSTAEIK